jgi:hypothetical protein
MTAQARFKSIHWMLLAVLALTPAVARAQQDNASQSAKPRTEEAQGKSETGQAAQAKTDVAQGQKQEAQVRTEEPQKQTEEAQAKTEEGGKLISVPGGKALGMSILGNQEAPTSLVIVPWKTSELGNSAGISTMLDNSRQPVDKEVFLRALSYYEIRSEKK